MEWIRILSEMLPPRKGSHRRIICRRLRSFLFRS
ncbi:hypothetical protein J2X83_000848 [Brevibacillus nitrificans]|nr:hypothetical protein [Brevibacillus nitrificans]